METSSKEGGVAEIWYRDSKTPRKILIDLENWWPHQKMTLTLFVDSESTLNDLTQFWIWLFKCDTDLLKECDWYYYENQNDQFPKEGKLVKIPTHIALNKIKPKPNPNFSCRCIHSKFSGHGCLHHQSHHHLNFDLLLDLDENEIYLIDDSKFGNVMRVNRVTSESFETLCLF